jgi:hypothetical protein
VDGYCIDPGPGASWIESLDLVVVQVRLDVHSSEVALLSDEAKAWPQVEVDASYVVKGRLANAKVQLGSWEVVIPVAVVDTFEGEVSQVKHQVEPVGRIVELEPEPELGLEPVPELEQQQLVVEP